MTEKSLIISTTKMGHVNACRICLVTDVKMFDLQATALDLYFEPIIGMNPLCFLELPSFVCYECAALIKKYYFFREKCLKGQSVLYDILHGDGLISIEKVRKVDRQHHRLTSHLTAHQTNDVKHEVHFEHDTSQVALLLSDQSRISVNLYDDLELKIKLEEPLDDYEALPSPVAPSSDDDEPLSLQKTVKEKKKKGEKKKKKAEVKKSETDEESAGWEGDSMIAEAPPTPSESAVSRKRGRPPKRPLAARHAEQPPKPRRTINTGGVVFDADHLEDYVTVVKLTIEEQIEEINKRKQSRNYLNAPFQCSLCFKGFIDTDAWKHHVEKHAPSSGDVQCVVCKFRFKTKRVLQKHASNHEKRYACKSCSYISKTTTQAKQHQRWHKGVTYKCQYCDEVSTKWTSYLSHVRIKHPSEFICGVCGYSFVSRLGLNMHKTMMHKDTTEEQALQGVEPGPYCASCDVQFVSTEAWKRHMVTSVKHIRMETFSNGCRVCGDTFKSSEELRLHHRKEHARKRPKNYGKKPSNMTWPAKCEHCDAEIPNAREYWTHFRRVHPDKKYPIQKSYICEICGKSFRGNAFLVYHKRTHFEERTFKCAQCPKAFFNRTNLQMHEKTHSDHRPYPCSVCLKAFKGKGALDRHFRSHTGEKPYECEYCGKGFGQSNSRKLHVRTVHLKQPAPYVSRSRLERRRQAKDQADVKMTAPLQELHFRI